jgi:hypothetical protein
VFFVPKNPPLAVIWPPFSPVDHDQWGDFALPFGNPIDQGLGGIPSPTWTEPLDQRLPPLDQDTATLRMRGFWRDRKRGSRKGIRMARPNKLPDEKRLASIRADLTVAEKIFVQEQAAKAGMSEAEYTRRRDSPRPVGRTHRCWPRSIASA